MLKCFLPNVWVCIKDILKGYQFRKSKPFIPERGGSVVQSRCCRFEPHSRHCVVSLSKTHYRLLNSDSTQEDPSRYDWKLLTRTYRIKSNVPLVQLQRNCNGECLHKSLAAAQESLSFRYQSCLTWTCLFADQPFILHERVSAFVFNVLSTYEVYGDGARV